MSLEIEDSATYPYPGMSYPVNITFSPNDKKIAFLRSPENELARQLYSMDLKTQTISLMASPPNNGNTEENLSLEEKLRRERQRQMGVGITSYIWCPRANSQKVLIPIQGNLYIQERPGDELKLLFDKSSTGANGGAIDPQFSPDGNYIAFVQQDEIYIISSDISENVLPKACQVTKGARENGLTNGVACFLTQEELSRFKGYWWSPDSTKIAYEQVDERHIPKFRIMHSGKDSHGSDAQEDHRYPFAGGPNPKRRLAVVKLPENLGDFQEPVWMQHDTSDEGFYYSRVLWMPDGSLCAQKLNRLQTESSLLRFNIANGESSVLIQEESNVWINVHYLFRTLSLSENGSFKFIWGSEKTGFMHLYLYEFDSKTQSASLLGALTSGEWVVESIEGIDQHPTEGVVYATGTYSNPLEKHLYAIRLHPNPTTSSPVRLTKEEGMHSCVIDPALEYFVDFYSNLGQPPTALVKKLPCRSIFHKTVGLDCYDHIEVLESPLHVSKDSRLERLQKCLTSPEILSFKSRDGASLYGALYKPDKSIHGDGPYPTIVSVYGGPHVQRVANMWSATVDMRAQRFRAEGYAVLKVDNRGSFRRGLAFEGAIKHCMGTVEVLDQEDGVLKLIGEGITEKNRVGIYGWSYGGYMTAICLMKSPDIFKVGVSGAPVTSWDGYDTCYTERYMSTPQLNPEGYREGSVMQFVNGLKDSQHLLLVHGLIDENVHFRHTARLINALISARKDYDVLLFPEERHSPRRLKDRIYMEQRILNYFMKHL